MADPRDYDEEVFRPHPLGPRIDKYKPARPAKNFAELIEWSQENGLSEASMTGYAIWWAIQRWAKPLRDKSANEAVGRHLTVSGVGISNIGIAVAITPLQRKIAAACHEAWTKEGRPYLTMGMEEAQRSAIRKHKLPNRKAN